MYAAAARHKRGTQHLHTQTEEGRKLLIQERERERESTQRITHESWVRPSRSRLEPDLVESLGHKHAPRIGGVNDGDAARLQAHEQHVLVVGEGEGSHRASAAIIDDVGKA